MPNPKDFKQLAQDAAADGRLDPFLLQFLFAMGELSGQVQSLAAAVLRLEGVIKGQDEEIEALKAKVWLATGGATVIGTMIGFAVEYYLGHH